MTLEFEENFLSDYFVNAVSITNKKFWHLRQIFIDEFRHTPSLIL